MDDYRKQCDEFVRNKRITKSANMFKIKLFLDKGENSLQIAKHYKDIVPE